MSQIRFGGAATVPREPSQLFLEILLDKISPCFSLAFESPLPLYPCSELAVIELLAMRSDGRRCACLGWVWGLEEGGGSKCLYRRYCLHQPFGELCRERDTQPTGATPWSEPLGGHMPRATHAGDGNSDDNFRRFVEGRSTQELFHRSCSPSRTVGVIRKPGGLDQEGPTSGKEGKSVQPREGTLTSAPFRKAWKRPSQMLYNPRSRHLPIVQVT
jgi:hypothetical protein